MAEDEPFVVHAKAMQNGGVGGEIEIYNWEGDLLWEYQVSNDTFQHHHDIQPLPNGNVLILAWEKKSIEEAESLGATNMMTEEIWPEHIIEIEKNNLILDTIMYKHFLFINS